MAVITICSDFGAQNHKLSHCFHCFPLYFPWSDGTVCHDLRFWMLSFSLSSFTFLKRLFSSSSLSAIRVVSSAYLRLSIFLSAILIPACVSSSPAFLISRVTIYSLDTLLFLYGTSLFHVQFKLLFPVLHTDFSRGRSGGLVFPSLSEYSTVYCDPHSQRLWHSQ